MLGKQACPCLSAKGKETQGLLGFTVLLLSRNMAKLEAEGDPIAQRGRFLLAAGRAADKFDAGLDRCPRLVEPVIQQALLDHLLRFSKCFVLGGGRLTPKFHAMVHMVQRSAYMGNPKIYHTYHDESVNAVVKSIASSCHRNTLGATAIWKCSALQGFCRE